MKTILSKADFPEQELCTRKKNADLWFYSTRTLLGVKNMIFLMNKGEISYGRV